MALLTAVAVCSGGGSYEALPVQGSITFQGQAVQGGSIAFRPVSIADAEPGMIGKPPSTEVEQDGTFVLSSYGEVDVAMAGEHVVIYAPVYEWAASYNDKPKLSSYAGLVEIELVSPPPRQ